VYLAWAVPDCAPGCLGQWLGDGYCDRCVAAPRHPLGGEEVWDPDQARC